jgi:hypothetical protein
VYVLPVVAEEVGDGVGDDHDHQTKEQRGFVSCARGGLELQWHRYR